MAFNNGYTNRATKKPTTAKKPVAIKTTDKKMSQIDAAIAVLKEARKLMVEVMSTAKLWKRTGGKIRRRTLYS